MNSRIPPFDLNFYPTDKDNKQIPYLENDLTSISTIAESQGFIFFSYDTKIKTLLSWTDNLEQTLGANLKSLQREANFLLKYAHEDDLYQLITALEESITKNNNFNVTYRWRNPNSKKISWFSCRAKLNIKNGQEILEGVIYEIAATANDSRNNILASFPGINFILDKDLNICDLNTPFEYAGFSFGELEFKQDLFAPGRSFTQALENTDTIKLIEQAAGEIFSEKISNFDKILTDTDSIYNLSIRPIKSNQLTSALLVSITNQDKLAQTEKELALLKETIALRLLSENSIHNLNNLLQAIGGYAAILSLKANSASQAEIINTCSQIQECLTQSGSILHNIIESEISATNFPNEICKKIDLNTFIISVISGLSPGTTYENQLLDFKTKFNSLSRILAPEKFLLRYFQKLFLLLLETSKILTVETFEVKDCAKLEILYKKPPAVNHELARFLSKEDQRTLKDYNIKLKRSLLRNSAEIIEIFLPLAEQHNNLPTLENNQTADCVLIVDDDFRTLKATSEILKSQKISCLCAQNVFEAKLLLEQKPANLSLVIADGILPHEPGAELVKFIKLRYPELIVIGLTGSDKNVQKDLLAAGACEVFRKPISPFILASKIRDFLSPRKAA